MPLQPGTTLGPYQIDAPLGAGGMGEVYKATDTRLDRTVAIKVLPEHVAADPDLKQRFEREAKAVAALNHPHICTLHDIGSQDGIDFLVMEYLDGDMLAKRLEKGALPLDQALQIAIEIADALDKAHRQRIVHRDLKPGNIMLTKAGAKLLDFGLAKLKPAEPAGGLSALPTQGAPLTQEGSILGTFQYMAPEQLEGQEADARTDIFAFGAVVYEMVTWRKAFEGKSQASLISAIMTADPPPMSSLQVMSPPALDQIVKTCLAKDPDSRWQTAGDVGRQLQWITEGGSQVGVPTVAATPRKTREWLVGTAAAMVAAILTGAIMWSLRPPSPPHPVVDHVSVALPPGVRVPNELLPLALSSDGRHLVYVGVSGGASQLYHRAMDQRDSVPLSGTEGAQWPFFSPDGQWIGFTADGTLRKVPLAGGRAVTICELPPDGGGVAGWGPDDRIWFTAVGTGLYAVSAAGGVPQVVTTPAEGESAHARPHPLPNGRGVVFTVYRGGLVVSSAQVAVYSHETGEHRVLADGGPAQFAPSGHLVFANRDGGVSALPFDAETLEATGIPVPVFDGVRDDTGQGVLPFHLGDDGSLAYVPGGRNRSLVWVDRTGNEEPIEAEIDAYANPSLSPDGRQVAVEIRSGDRDIWILDLVTSTQTRLTFDPARDWSPLWTPSGDRIVFGSNRGASPGLFSRAADGTGQAEQILTVDGRGFYPYSWSGDGQRLAVGSDTPGYDVGFISMGAEPTWHPLLDESYAEANPAISPDGQWMAYASHEAGPGERTGLGQLSFFTSRGPGSSRFRSTALAEPIVGSPTGRGADPNR